MTDIKQTDDKQKKAKRTMLSQSEIPSVKLSEALRIPIALRDNYALRSATPLDIGVAIGIAPTSGGFRTLTGAAIAYGLTNGGYNASEIVLTDLGRRIVAPTVEGDEEVAKREAFEKPRVIHEFITKYDGSKLPASKQIAQNVLHTMGVPFEATERAYELLTAGLKELGYLRDVNGSQFIQRSSVSQKSSLEKVEEVVDEEDPQAPASPLDSTPAATISKKSINERRVFITHGKNKKFIEPIKKLLNFGELEPVVSEDRESVSQPVPDKVLNDMRSCGAAIIHVDSETKLIDTDTKEHIVLNPNVLIEIGAAMALYGRRFILLVDEGITLPSNLQGLYEVRYSGDDLGSDTTIKLLEAIKDIKNHPLPDSKD